ncbi:hypothetical protein LG284_14175 [Citricoccus nitrophenolicus]
MAVGYRSILELGRADNALIVARDAVRDWVHEKSTRQGLAMQALDLGVDGIHQLGSDMIVTTALIHDDAVGRTQQVFRLVETNQTGRWQVTIVALSDRLDSGVNERPQQTLMIEVDPLDMAADDAILKAKPPRLVRSLLASHPVRSGSVAMTERPVVVDSDGIEKVLSAISDPDRSAAVVVAASLDGVDTDTWTDVVASLLRDSLGVSTGFVLTVEATQSINRRLPYGFHINRGGIRTFAPGADLSDDTDQYRHRYLGPQTFARHIDYRRSRGRMRLVVNAGFAATHAQRARRRFVELSLPPHVRRAIDSLRSAELKVERNEAALPVVATVTEPRPVPRPSVPSEPSETPQPIRREEQPQGRSSTGQPEESAAQPTAPTGTPPESAVLHVPVWMDALQELVESTTGAQEVTVDSIRRIANVIATSKRSVDVAERQLEEVFDEWQRTEEERDGLRDELVDAYLESTSASETAQDYQRRFEHYQRLLLEAERYEDLVVPDEDERWTPPEDFDEFLLRVSGDGKVVEPVSDYIVFTGDRDAALAIDDRDQTSRYVRHMWDFVKVLDSFASVRDGGFEGDVRAYLNADNVIGHKCTHRQHAATESESVRTRKAWHDERLFPVPPSVQSDGRVHMLAHFRPSHNNTFAPRMHYYDDTANTGKVYIGYIGRHLSNTKTSSM